MPVVKSPRVCFAISTQCGCVTACVCAHLFIFALQLTPQVMAHTASAHQTLRVRPIFHPFDFVESFVRCHHGDLNRLCQPLYWQHLFSSSCLYFPTITSLSVFSLFSSLICANLPFCHPHRRYSITPYFEIYLKFLPHPWSFVWFPPISLYFYYMLHVYSRMIHING